MNDTWKEWGEDFYKKVNVSYSMLNKYFLSPDNFRKEYLLWLKDLPTLNMAWGILSHSLIKTRNKGKWTSNEAGLKAVFESELKKYAPYLDKNDISELNNRLPILLRLLPELPTQKYSEAKIVTEINWIKLEWYLDAFDIIDSSISLTDYKSWKVKSDSEIQKVNEYDFKWAIAQLYFYKILIENAESFTYNWSSIKLPVNKVTQWNLVYFSEKWIETKTFILDDIEYENSLKEDIFKFVELLNWGYLWVG
jgi:hypothetical protein